MGCAYGDVMNIDRLFHILVVMGGASSVGCENSLDDIKRAPAPDARAPLTDAGTSDAGADLEPCVCDVEVCCDRSSDPARVEAGFECCWATTCP